MVLSTKMKGTGRDPRDTDLTQAIVQAIQGGLPLVERPYAAIGRALGIDESAVIARISQLLADGSIRRLGVVVRHQELGYRANAMVVWDLPDARVDALGARIGTIPFVTLCYRRPRRLPDWPYNLFTMIHGRSRQAVLEQVAEVAAGLGLGSVPHAVLFSGQRFKQRGALYRSPGLASEPDRQPAGPGAGSDVPHSAPARRPALAAPLERRTSA